jgi:branched-chain amino acid transport system substrate-binding protein
MVNLGQSAQAAAEIAMEEINAHGGINGRPLKLIFEDDKCNPPEATKTANKLFNNDNVQIIIGAACSGSTLAISPIAEESQRVLISYCSSAPRITDAGQYTYRTYPSDNFEATFVAHRLHDEGVRKVAILSCLNDYCQGQREVFVRVFSGFPGTAVVAEEKFESESRDLRTQLVKLQQSNPDALYFLGYVEATIPVLVQIRELGWDVPIFGSNVWDDPNIPKEAGVAAEGIRYALVSPATPSWFDDAMRTKDRPIVLCTPQSYDTVQLVAQLLRQGATTGPELKKALDSMGPYQGLSGTISFDGNGDVKEAELTVRQIVNGSAQTVR